MSEDDKDPAGGAPDNGSRKSEPEYFPGERGRTVPRSAWWILGIALVVLLAFVIVRPTWFTQDYDDTSLHVPAERHFDRTLAGLGYADGAWLGDESPSLSFPVTLPVDSGREQTRLHLRGSTQVAQDSTVFLAVEVNGRQVYRSELARGDNELDVLVDVPQYLAVDGQLRVRVHTEGMLNNQVCVNDRSAGMRIHLDPETVVEAALDEPIHTIRDAVASWDRRLTVVLADQSDTWRTTAAQLGVTLTRAGYQVDFADRLPESDEHSVLLVGPPQQLTELTGWDAGDPAGNGIALGTVTDTPVVGVIEPDGSLIGNFLTEPVSGTADSAGSAPRALATPPITGDQVGLEAFGADMSVTQVAESHRWRAGYSLADLPGGRLPRAVRVGFRLPASPDDLTWVLNVELNGQLLDSRRLDRSGGEVVIPLPAGAHLLDNQLTLTVQRDRDLGGCDVRVTSYPIQLTGVSALELGDETAPGFTGLPRDLAPGFSVYVPEAAGADISSLLDATVPVLSEFVPAQYSPTFRWNTQPAPGQPFVLVGQSPEVNPPVSVRDGRLVAGPGQPALDISSFDNGIVVDRATSRGGAAGLVIQPVGDIGPVPLPAFGPESAQVVTAQGSFAVNADGSVATAGPGRTDRPR
ncbi:hypothetical protein [Nocardia sp. NPDC019395]|uniref:hypothetical protein n=1 Tax=Nocardia sp. NPDC019395 TaxID=3154686 RepID=UPI0033BFCFFE